MRKQIELNKNWSVLQDVHDAGEKLDLYTKKESCVDIHSQMSEWEPIEELKHLQLMFASEPYFGRELRYFNQAPWWYKNEFEVSEEKTGKAYLKFTNVDYYCKVWLNGIYLGDHEGYSSPFTFDVSRQLNYGESNLLIVKVSSPWDCEVEGNDETNRTCLVRRNMVKGTYEHSDTFVQRDVNPIGIYGDVELELNYNEFLLKDPLITYDLDLERKEAEITVEVMLGNMIAGKRYTIRTCVKEKGSQLICGACEMTFEANADTMKQYSKVTACHIREWNTWDHGNSWMYIVEVVLEEAGEELSRTSSSTAFRTIELERTEDRTVFKLNDKKFYVRGTSYFPDNYISAMSRDRYWRDLLNIKNAGFNLVRVHVHTEFQIFYELCDELGIAVIQDSEYNWTHPATDEWAHKFIDIYKENIRMLMNHPSIICWIGMNEPGNVDPDGKTKHRFMEENPGPKMYKEISQMDPSRPIIKGSFCENDLYSGDSHNYLGSLSGGEYKDIYGTTEKFNTEFGFDAPGCAENLKKVPKLYKRLHSVKQGIPKIQEYQYKLLKYYIEHYRIQKYNPCSGYVQFMFIDLNPQSFYGIYDWWGVPKKGLQAVLESNMPIGVFLKYREKLDAIYLVNDTDYELKNCRVEWCIMDGTSGECVHRGEEYVTAKEDSVLEVETLNMERSGHGHWNVTLKLWGEQGECLAKNEYRDVFELMSRVDGHPDRMSHEYGMRLYWA